MYWGNKAARTGSNTVAALHDRPWTPSPPGTDRGPVPPRLHQPIAVPVSHVPNVKRLIFSSCPFSSLFTSLLVGAYIPSYFAVTTTSVVHHLTTVIPFGPESVCCCYAITPSPPTNTCMYICPFAITTDPRPTAVQLAPRQPLAIPPRRQPLLRVHF